MTCQLQKKYRVILYDDYVCIYYNISPDCPTKVKLEKEELEALSDKRVETMNNAAENKENTQFEPQKFKLGATGGELGIRSCFAKGITFMMSVCLLLNFGRYAARAATRICALLRYIAKNAPSQGAFS